MTKKHILREIRRAAEENGGIPLGRMRFRRESGIRESQWFGKFWTRWSDAVREAGYAPNPFGRRYEDDYLFAKYIALARAIGRLPTIGDLMMKARSDESYPYARVFRRFGTKPQFIQRLAGRCRGRKGFEDIVRMCEAYSSRTVWSAKRRLYVDRNLGAVYLMRAGAFYKIGRSKLAKRRLFQLRIQLPERLRLVHVIRTDDPTGVEAYWHERFARLRRNGEWFALSTSDVAAFRRRKFM